MEISYLGRSCFKLVGKKILVLIDPFDPVKVGVKLSKQDADVVLVTHGHYDHNNTSVLKSDFLLFDSAGEYEVKDSEFVGIPSFHDDKNGEELGGNTIFAFDIDGVKVCHLGDIGSELTSEQLDKMDGVDILIIPVGGKFTIDAKSAVKVVNQVEPKIVIPMHYKDAENNGLAPVEDFLHEMSVQPNAQEKLKVTTKDLPQELEVVVLKY